MRRIVVWTGCILISIIGLAYFHQMSVRGGFESLPADTPIPEIRVRKGNNRLETDDTFSFAVIGDMRWESRPRIAVLQKAQSENPLFMVNLGDVVDYARKEEWQIYVTELEKYWNREIPYFHIPGGHSLNVRLSGVSPEFFEYYFGRKNYFVDASYWRFIFLDSSYWIVSSRQFSWLKSTLEDAKSQNMRSVLFMHHPPLDKAQGVDHALSGISTKHLADALTGYDVAAIFAAHIHSVFEYKWKSIPVYVTALSGDAWHNKPAEFRKIEIINDKMAVTTISVEKNN